MSDVDRVGAEMKRNIFDFVSHLQTTKEIKLDAFEKIDQSSRELTKLLKGSEMLPRKWLYELDMAAGILEAEAPYAEDAKLIEEMASKLRMTFGIIICGECHNDRKPGVMRIT
jgi:hypothetical protein